jgi:hypothetical protein
MSVNKKVLNIRYVEKYKYDNGICVPVFNDIKVTTSHSKRYHNCLQILADLQGCPRNLIEFLVEKMDSNNNVVSNKHIIKEFIEIMKKANISYSVDTVNKAFKKLKDKNLLLLVGRGYYQVNPMYFSKNNDNNREYLIKMNLEAEHTNKNLLQENNEIS